MASVARVVLVSSVVGLLMAFGTGCGKPPNTGDSGTGGSTGGGTGGDVGGGTGGATGGGTGGATGGGTGGDVGGGTGGSTGGGTGGATGGGTGGDVGGGTGGATGGGTGGATGGGTGGATGGGTGGGAGTLDAGTTPSEQIAFLRAAIDGGLLQDVTVEGALVTYLKPLVNDAGTSDPAGFFIQADPTGPALFVAVDPTNVGGTAVAVGDNVTLTATAVARVGSSQNPIAISSVSSLTKNSGGNPISSLAQSVSGADFTVAGTLDSYESELVSVQGTLAGPLAGAANGYVANVLATTGTPDGGSLKLRVPAALGTSQDLDRGCTLTTGNVPMWRFGATAEPSPFELSELPSLTCPAPKLLSASALSTDQVVASFDRNVDVSTVSAGVFTITLSDGGTGLSVADAGLTSARQVLLVTSAQTNVESYQLTAATTLKDTRGSTLDPNATSAGFFGIGAGACTPNVVISQIYGSGSSTAAYNQDFVELHNRSSVPVSVAGWAVQYAAATSGNWSVISLSGSIPAGGFYLVGFSSATGGTSLPTPEASSTLNLNGTSAKLALTSNATALGTTSSPVLCPTGGSIVDFVGYGTSANCSLGTANAPAPSAANSIMRKELADAGVAAPACVDTFQNGSDFVATPPLARNGGSPAASCTCP